MMTFSHVVGVLSVGVRDGGEGVRREYADEQGEDGSDDDGDDNVDGVVHDTCA